MDLGCYIEEVSSRLHGLGATEYFALEVSALKRLYTANNHADLSVLPPFTASADVWAANVCWMELFRYERPTMRSEFRDEGGVWGPSPSSLDMVYKGLEIESRFVSERIRPVYPILIAALAVEPNKRPSAKSIAKQLDETKDSFEGGVKTTSVAEPLAKKQKVAA